MTHEEKIQNVARQIKARAATREPVIFTKKSVSHLVPNPRDLKHARPKIYLGDLDQIISMNPEEKTCVAESGVTFYDLVKATLPYNLVPYTVPELKTITIGGAVSGCSLESLSYKYGGFHDSCLEYEFITGEGEIATASPERDLETFQMLHGSYGTLGVLTQLKFKLYPAKPFVKMEYVKFADFKSFWDYLRERCEKKDREFVDAIIHNKNSFVVCLGGMVETAPYVSAYDGIKIFYQSTLFKKEDYLTTVQYFFRYDNDCHWLSKTIPPLEWPLVRFLFDRWLLGSTNMIKWSQRLGNILKLKKRPDVIVDIFIPAQKFEEFYAWYEKDFDFYPLWIVPYRMPEVYPWVNPERAAKTGEKFYIDCAIYGKKNNQPEVDYAQILEEEVFKLGGIKTLISSNYYSEERFWQIYNQEKYQAIKQKTDPNNVFGTIFGNLVKK